VCSPTSLKVITFPLGIDGLGAGAFLIVNPINRAWIAQPDMSNKNKARVFITLALFLLSMLNINIYTRE
jgi:hypothetical protein